MNICEDHSKSLLKQYDVDIPFEFSVSQQEINKVEQFSKKLKELKNVFVKAQIPFGGRAKGFFKDQEKCNLSGVCRCKVSQLRGVVEGMIENTLVTSQTGEQGCRVDRVLISECIDVQSEFYFSISIDRKVNCPVVTVSRNGGIQVEEIENLDHFLKLQLHPWNGFFNFQKRNIAAFLGLSYTEKIGSICDACYRLFCEKDLSLLEINPLVLAKNGQIVAVDAKIEVDDNALFRHQDLATWRNEQEVVEAAYGIRCVPLTGNIACITNGAGLSMATIDLLETLNGKAANFLDISGLASERQVEKVCEIVANLPQYNVLYVNVFGGMAQCDFVAKGLLSGLKYFDADLPIVIRFEGAGKEEAYKILSNFGKRFLMESDFKKSAQIAVQIAAKS